MNRERRVAVADRLDRALAAADPELSRGEARRLIAAGAVFLNGTRCRIASKLARAGDRLRVSDEATVASTHPPDKPPLPIVFEDNVLVAIDKPANMPAVPTRQGTVGCALDLLHQQLHERDGRRQQLWVVHRIDAATSGVLVFTKTKAAAARLSKLFAEQDVEKHYRAEVAGDLKGDSGVIELRLNDRGRQAVVDEQSGKAARTEWAVVERKSGSTVVDVHPRTGRMHQIRVHFAAIGHPVIGDRLYGGPSASRLMLHAQSLSFRHPLSGRLIILGQSSNPQA